jgi:glycine cleavage system H protein
MAINTAEEGSGMSEIPEQLRYTSDHEWLRTEGDSSVVVGITSHAQRQLGELVYVELPEVGHAVSAGDGCAVVESVKAASDVYAPVTGQITAVNSALNDEPGKVNTSPYGDGWLFRMKLADPAELTALLDAAGYEKLLAAEA